MDLLFFPRIDESILEQRAGQRTEVILRYAEEPVDIYLFRAHGDAELRYAEATPPLRKTSGERRCVSATHVRLLNIVDKYIDICFVYYVIFISKNGKMKKLHLYI